MDEAERVLWRIERLEAAVLKLDGGNMSAFGRRLGWKGGDFVRQMLAGRRPITEKLVDQIQAMPGMAGWFAAKDEKAWPFSAELYSAVQGLQEDGLRRAENVLRAHVGLAQLGATPTEQVPQEDQRDREDREAEEDEAITRGLMRSARRLGQRPTPTVKKRGSG